MVCAWNSSWGNKGVSMKNSVEVKNISFSYGKTEILNDLKDYNLEVVYHF